MFKAVYVIQGSFLQIKLGVHYTVMKFTVRIRDLDKPNFVTVVWFNAQANFFYIYNNSCLSSKVVKSDSKIVSYFVSLNP